MVVGRLERVRGGSGQCALYIYTCKYNKQSISLIAPHPFSLSTNALPIHFPPIIETELCSHQKPSRQPLPDLGLLDHRTVSRNNLSV